MKNLKIGEISSSGQKQGENTKIGKLPRESRRLGSYANAFKNVKNHNFFEKINKYLS